MTTRRTNSIVWRPGGTSSNGKLATWAEVYATFTESVGVTQILLDASLSTTFTMPAGAYDFEHRLIFRAQRNSVLSVSVAIADGVTISNFYMVSGPVVLDYQGAGTCCSLGAGINVYVEDGAALQASGLGGRFFDSNARALLIRLVNGQLLQSSTAVVVHGSGGGTGVAIWYTGRCNIGTNTIDSIAGTPTIILGDDYGAQFGLQAGLAGGATLTGLFTNPVLFNGVYAGGAGVVTSFMGQGSAPAAASLEMPLDRAYAAINLRVRVPVGGNTLGAAATVTVYKNGVATTLTLNIGAGATGVFTATAAGGAEPRFADTDAIDLVITSNAAGGGTLLTFGACIGVS